MEEINESLKENQEIKQVKEEKKTVQDLKTETEIIKRPTNCGISQNEKYG